MAAYKNRVLAGIEEVRASLASEAALPPHGSPENPIEVVVLHTTEARTRLALETAATLTRGLAARIRLLAPLVVPYPLPLTAPPVRAEFLENLLQAMAEDLPVETWIEVRLCRDRNQTIAQALPPHSVVVIGGQRRWWPLPGLGLKSWLGRLGHQVVDAGAY